jgi:hypothetical protein
LSSLLQTQFFSFLFHPCMEDCYLRRKCAACAVDLFTCHWRLEGRNCRSWARCRHLPTVVYPAPRVFSINWVEVKKSKRYVVFFFSWIFWLAQCLPFGTFKFHSSSVILHGAICLGGGGI